MAASYVKWIEVRAALLPPVCVPLLDSEALSCTCDGTVQETRRQAVLVNSTDGGKQYG
jgi:hypothetical protein